MYAAIIGAAIAGVAIIFFELVLHFSLLKTSWNVLPE
jgi:hypothetical protein